MEDHIRFVSGQTNNADTLPALLTAAFYGLETIERATSLLSEHAPPHCREACGTALAEAVNAWWALSDAPAWAVPSGPASFPELASLTAELVLLVSETLLKAANKTSLSADQVACLAAVDHAGRVHAALRRIA
ncbi:hypothetical protein [Actinomadura gamaensis]|uniref:Uncharacterized protein n=1 Tax=Actinomadura gamaensis TaxID=1763541 RepID=A0ABV9TU17_9ACTN